MRAVAVILLLSACTTLPREIPTVEEGAEPLPDPMHMGVQTIMIDDELAQFRVAIDRPRASSDIDAYTDCAAAQYADIRGYGYARRIRTNIDQRGRAWVADAVYALSKDAPNGERVIDARPTIAACKASGIPTV